MRELEQVRRTRGWNHPKAAEILSTIGLYQQHMARDLDAALSYFEQALSVLYSHQCNPPPAPGRSRTTLGGDDDDGGDGGVNGNGAGGGGGGCEVEVAVTLTDMGNVLRGMGRCEEAVNAYRQAMIIFEEKATSRNHPSIQAASRGLAMLRAYSTSTGDGQNNNEARSRTR